MNIRLLQHFATVAETLNFRQAAELMNLSQQAISKSIMQLERQLGVRLLDRSRHGVVLTEAGRRILPFALDVVASARRLENTVANVASNQSETISVGATPTFLESILPEVLDRFSTAFPRIRITIERGDFASLSGAMARGDLDLILSTAPAQIPRHLVKAAVIGQDHNVIVARPGHPLAGKAEVRCAELLDYPHIATINYPRGADFVTALFASEALHPPPPAMTIGSTSLAHQRLSNTNSWWVTPQLLVLRQINAGVLVTLPTPGAVDRWDLIMATRRHAVISQAVIAFQQMVEESLIGCNVRTAISSHASRAGGEA